MRAGADCGVLGTMRHELGWWTTLRTVALHIADGNRLCRRAVRDAVHRLACIMAG